MHRIITVCILLVSSLAYSTLNAQTADGLIQDAEGHYTFSHTSTVPDAAKDVLYGRLRTFVVEGLNASDTYIQWDEAGHDSVTTVAFIELPDEEGLTNQIIDCKARIDFSEGSATLRLSGFNYSVIANDKSYARPMYRMDPIPYYAQSYVKIALSEKLEHIAALMDAAARGKGMSPKRTKAARHKAVSARWAHEPR